MPIILNTPRVAIPPERPPVTIFEGTGNLTEVTGTKTVTRGNEQYTVPVWAACGLTVESDCGIVPTIVKEKFCNFTELIEPTWEGSDSDLPLNMIFRGGNPDITAPYKTYDTQDCCPYAFVPLMQKVRLAARLCESDVDAKAINYLEALAHRKLTDSLFKQLNGNPTLPITALNVTPDGPVSPHDGLQALHNNHLYHSRLFVPYQALGKLRKEELIHMANGTQYVDDWFTPVLTDPTATGLIGPPPRNTDPDTIWDGQTPIDPTAVEENVTTLPADSGTAWIYLTGSIWTGVTAGTVQGSPKANGDEETRGNWDSTLAELQTMAVFDPCHVVAAQIQLSEGIKC